MDLKEIPTLLRVGVALIAGIWGGLEPLVQLLVLLMVFDIVTGIGAAFAGKRLSSACSFQGMTKKAMILGLVAVAQIVEGYLAMQTESHIPLGEGVAGFYAAGEGVSILENAALAGLPIPEALKEALAKLNPEKAARQS